MSQSIYDFRVKRIDGTETTLSDYKGKTMLIVNTASKCGLTPQYEGLNQLYKNYKDQGLVVLGFPCNQFLGQEPGDEKAIASFCEMNFDIQFPMFSKIEVNGSNAHPLYEYLKSEARGTLGFKRITWNFTKFLVDPSGRVVRRFKPTEVPAKIDAEVQRKLPS